MRPLLRLLKEPFGFPSDPPQLGISEIGKVRAELVAKQPKQGKYRIRIGGSVRNAFRRLQLGFMFQVKRQQG